MAFIAEDIAAWLIGFLADRGRRRLTTVLLGTEQERALRSAATAAVEQAARGLRPDDDARAEQLVLVISQSVPEVPQDRHQTMLKGLQAGAMVKPSDGSRWLAAGLARLPRALHLMGVDKLATLEDNDE
jgi:hypothetical protein